LFDVLRVDTFPKLPKEEDFTVYARQMRNSIFIPRVGGRGVENESSDGLRSTKVEDHSKHAGIEVGGGAGGYGTQKQTVVLVDRTGKVTFIEQTLYDQEAQASQSEKRYEFQIEG
jgi:uncharacterized protein with NRDE domain